MKKVLVTGGTTFVSKYIATYFLKQGNEVYVLNRNSKPQTDGVILIECDRKHIGNRLKGIRFNVVIDVNAYTAEDIGLLVEALDSFDDYIFISSSAVYPETNVQPFNEEQLCGYNSIWKDYGMNKLEAEQSLSLAVPNAYILRPPYLYGPMQNLYREPFVFDCALNERTFYLPEDGEMKLHFFHVEDLCRLIESIVQVHPKDKIFNVGNDEIITVKKWVELCYQVVGKKPIFVNVNNKDQRDYFCFYNYEYILDVTRQNELLTNKKTLLEGLSESYKWYQDNEDSVVKKPYLTFIDNELGK